MSAPTSPTSPTSPAPRATSPISPAKESAPPSPCIEAGATLKKLECLEVVTAAERFERKEIDIGFVEYTVYEAIEECGSVDAVLATLFRCMASGVMGELEVDISVLLEHIERASTQSLPSFAEAFSWFTSHPSGHSREEALSFFSGPMGKKIGRDALTIKEWSEVMAKAHLSYFPHVSAELREELTAATIKQVAVLAEKPPPPAGPPPPPPAGPRPPPGPPPPSAWRGGGRRSSPAIKKKGPRATIGGAYEYPSGANMARKGFIAAALYAMQDMSHVNWLTRLHGGRANFDSHFAGVMRVAQAANFNRKERALEVELVREFNWHVAKRFIKHTGDTEPLLPTLAPAAPPVLQPPPVMAD